MRVFVWGSVRGDEVSLKIIGPFCRWVGGLWFGAISGQDPGHVQ